MPFPPLSEDPSFRVRKATAAAFANVCAAVGRDYAVQRLLPAFLKLAKDTIWGVRKGCVDNMIGVAGSMGLDVRVSVFVPMFEQLTKARVVGRDADGAIIGLHQI